MSIFHFQNMGIVKDKNSTSVLKETGTLEGVLSIYHLGCLVQQ